jgi:tRNA (guanine37-N1)-methyltransferase
MKIDILTLFPDTVGAVLHESILGRAAAKGIIEINTVQIRDFTENRQNQVDDYPYGGGFGCIMMAQPLKSCLDFVISGNEQRQISRERTRVIYMSPQGKTFDQETAKRLKSDYDSLILVCGHYEGVDERFIESCVDEEISLGNFVLTGGEIAAMAVADSVCRLVPGVLSDEQCYTGESHWDGLLEYPQYTRPEIWENRKVPDILLGGDHEKVRIWRRKKQLERTKNKRPDMWERFSPESREDRELMIQIEKESEAFHLNQPLAFREMTENDLDEVLRITSEARALIKGKGFDQWQGEYPSETLFKQDIENNIGYVVTHGDEVCAYFVITDTPEEDYESITDGKWSNDLPYCTIHRTAVAGKYHGNGVFAFILDTCEKMAKEKGIRYLRADTHGKNKAVQHVLKEKGFRYRGNVTVLCEPGHETARQAFEKRIK